MRKLLIYTLVLAMVLTVIPVGIVSASSSAITPSALGRYFMRYNMENDTRLIDMYMLGAHDAFTSGLSSSSAKDTAGIEIGDSGCSAASFIWTSSVINRSKAQSSNATEMLNSGVRYFDTRLSRPTADGEWWTTHGRLSDQFSGTGGVAASIAQWLSENPGEIVVLDIQSVYDIEQDGASATTASWADIASALDSAGLLQYVYTRNGSVSGHTYGSLTNNGTRAACVLIGQATGSWTAYNGQYYFINRRDSDGYVRSLWTESSSLSDLKTALASEVTTASSSSYSWKMRVMQAQTTGSNLVSDANTNNYSILTDANFETWNDVLRILQVDNATSDTNSFNSLALNTLAAKNRPATIKRESNGVKLTAANAAFPLSTAFSASAADAVSGAYSDLTSVNGKTVLGVKKVFTVSYTQGASTAVEPLAALTLTLPTASVASDKAAAVVRYDGGAYSTMTTTESVTTIAFDSAQSGTYLLVELDDAKPEGAQRAAAVPMSLDVSNEWMVQNASIEFDGSFATLGGGYSDAIINNQAGWSAWKSPFSGSNNTASSGNTNINLASDAALNRIQFYGAGGTAGAFSSVDAGGFAAGKGYFYIQFKATRSSKEWHDVALMDSEGNYFATYCFANDGLFPDDAKRSYNNTPAAISEVGSASASTDNLYYRIMVKNLLDTDTHSEYYTVAFATSSTENGTYSVYNTLTYSGSVNGFGGMNHKVGGAEKWYNNVSYGDFKVYSGDFSTYAPVTVNYKSGSETIYTSSFYALLGDYTYSASETYSTADGYYELVEAPSATVIEEGTNVIDVEYVKLGTFDTANNLITNGGFESGTTGWTTTAFTKQIVDGEDSFSLNTTNVHSGTYSLAQGTSVSSNAAGSLSTKWAITPGKTYRLTFYIYGSTSGTIQYCTAPLLKGTTERTNVIGNNGMSYSPEWTENSVIFTAGAEDTHVGVKIGWMVGISYDDFSLYELIPETTSATVHYYSTETGEHLIGTPAVAIEGYTSGAAGSVSGLNVGAAYSYASTSPLVLTNAGVTSTYIYDLTTPSVTTIAKLLPDAAKNQILLYYRAAQITAASYNGSNFVTRVGITPTLPTQGAADIWIEGNDTSQVADATADVVWGAVDVSTPGTKQVLGTISGYNGTVSVQITVKNEYQATALRQSAGSMVNWSGAQYIAAAQNTAYESAAITTDYDGNATYTGTGGQGFGSIRTATADFNTITPTAEKAYVLHMPTYMVDINTTSGTAGEIRITAGYGSKHIVSLNALATNGNVVREKTYDPNTTDFCFDVTDAIINGFCSFTLDAPMGGVGFPTFDMAAKGGAWEGCYPYIEEVDGVTLTGGAAVTKLTVAGNEVASGATVLPGYGAKAYFETALTDYAAEVFVNEASVTTLDETGATSYDLGAIDDDTSIYFTITDTTPIPDPEVTLTADAIDGGVGTNGMGILRFVTGVAVPEGEAVEYYGTYIIPKTIFDNGDDSTKITVKKTAAIADGKQYSADLKDIPSTMLDKEIYAWSFAKLANYEDIATAAFTATSVNAAAAE